MLAFIVFDPMYWMLIGPGLLLGLYAQFKVKSAFTKYSQVGFRNGMTGAEVARAILQTNNVHDVTVEQTGGFLSDHYDPRGKVLRLSQQNYSGRSVAAAGIAAHEVGHALQHAKGYQPLALRSALVPVAQIGSSLWMWLFFGGMFLGSAGQIFILAGIGLFAMSVLFSLVTLPVEFDASARALVALRDGGILAPGEEVGAKKVLDAAFLTYLAGLITAILTLLYLLLRSGLLGNNRD